MLASFSKDLAVWNFTDKISFSTATPFAWEVSKTQCFLIWASWILYLSEEIWDILEVRPNNDSIWNWKVMCCGVKSVQGEWLLIHFSQALIDTEILRLALLSGDNFLTSLQCNSLVWLTHDYLGRLLFHHLFWKVTNLVLNLKHLRTVEIAFQQPILGRLLFNQLFWEMINWVPK